MVLPCLPSRCSASGSMRCGKTDALISSACAPAGARRLVAFPLAQGVDNGNNIRTWFDGSHWSDDHCHRCQQTFRALRLRRQRSRMWRHRRSPYGQTMRALVFWPRPRAGLGQNDGFRRGQRTRRLGLPAHRYRRRSSQSRGPCCRRLPRPAAHSAARCAGAWMSFSVSFGHHLSSYSPKRWRSFGATSLAKRVVL